MNSLCNITFVLAVIFLIILEIKRTQFIGELKQKQESVWIQLGKPSGFFSSYLFKINGLKLEGYILKRRYSQLNDHQLIQLGNQFFVLEVAFILSIIAFFGVLVYQLATFTPS